MNSVQKFLFETSFDGAEDETAPPDAPPQANPQSFSESELERARDEGFAAGREQGLMEAAGSIENASARTLEAIAGEIRALLPGLAQDAERRNGEALKAAVTIVRKLFPRTAEAHGTAEIEALITQCLGQLRDEPRVVVRICDQLLDPLNERLGGLAADCGYEGKIVLLAEAALLPGDTLQGHTNPVQLLELTKALRCRSIGLPRGAHLDEAMVIAMMLDRIRVQVSQHLMQHGT